MQFGLDKCKTYFIHGGTREIGEVELENGARIEALEGNESYKYLGFIQTRFIEHTEEKKQAMNKSKDRLTQILKSYLNSKNMFKSINSYAIPVLAYTFGILQWTKTDIQAIERLTRTTLTKYRKHHPKSAIERLVIPRKIGGRGLIDINNLYCKITQNLKNYFYAKQNTSLLHRAVVKADANITPLNLSLIEGSNGMEVISVQDKCLAWSQKSLHGRHQYDLAQNYIDNEASNKWLSFGNFFPETEGFMIGIQDQVINTRNYQKYIMKDPNLITDRCRRCGLVTETIHHITSACQFLAQTDYLYRHNHVCKIIHQKIIVKHKLIESNIVLPPYYVYVPEVVLENETHRLYYDRSVITDRTIPHNRPDITLIDKINKVTYLIDITIPNSHNIQHSYDEKILKYAPLAEEVRQMWEMEKVITVPIVISSTGVIPHSLIKSLMIINIPKNTYMTIQKAVVLDTCNLVRRFLSTQPIQNTQSIHNTEHTHHTEYTTPLNSA